MSLTPDSKTSTTMIPYPTPTGAAATSSSAAGAPSSSTAGSDNKVSRMALKRKLEPCGNDQRIVNGALESVYEETKKRLKLTEEKNELQKKTIEIEGKLMQKQKELENIKQTEKQKDEKFNAQQRIIEELQDNIKQFQDIEQEINFYKKLSDNMEEACRINKLNLRDFEKTIETYPSWLVSEGIKTISISYYNDPKVIGAFDRSKISQVIRNITGIAEKNSATELNQFKEQLINPVTTIVGTYLKNNEMIIPQQEFSNDAANAAELSIQRITTDYKNSLSPKSMDLKST